jgi:riboflavin synthase
MFTGLIESVGNVLGIRPHEKDVDLDIDAGFDLNEDKLGDSVAVNGVCLTITKISKRSFTATASAETISRSTLDELSSGSKVNIERAMTLSSRLGGHLVLGHVDTVGTILNVRTVGESIRFKIQFDRGFSRYVIEKGSIAVDGISLTINRIYTDAFEVNIIPYTAKTVSLTLKGPGDRVNLEFDVIGKYVERLLHKENTTNLEELLKKQGFI